MSVETKSKPQPPKAMDEPKEGWSPMPVLLIGLLALILFWGFTQLDDHGGAFEKQVYPPYTSTNQLGELWPVDPREAQAREGKKLFEMNCAPCHMANGAGSEAVHAPPLAGSDWVNAEGPNRVVRIVLNGLQGPITVSSKQYGQGVMVPWRDSLKDEQIAAILTYVRGNKEWGNKAAAITPEQVKVIRDKTTSQVGPWNAPDLEKIPVKD